MQEKGRIGEGGIRMRNTEVVQGEVRGEVKSEVGREVMK